MPIVIPGASYDFGKVYAQTALQSQQLAAEQAMNQERIALERARLAQQADAQRAEMEQRAREFAASQGLTREGWQVQAGEAERGRRFASGERQAGQQFAAGEAEKGRGFSSREAELARMFSRGERQDTQAFQAGEGQKGREFARGERLGGQDFTATENTLNRMQQFAMIDAQHRYQLELQRNGFNHEGAMQAAQQQFQQSMADINAFHQLGLERVRQTGETARQDKNLDFQKRNAVVNQALDFAKIGVSGNPMSNPADLFNSALPGVKQEYGVPAEESPAAKKSSTAPTSSLKRWSETNAEEKKSEKDLAADYLAALDASEPFWQRAARKVGTPIANAVISAGTMGLSVPFLGTKPLSGTVHSADYARAVAEANGIDPVEMEKARQAYLNQQNSGAWSLTPF